MLFVDIDTTTFHVRMSNDSVGLSEFSSIHNAMNVLLYWPDSLYKAINKWNGLFKQDSNA